MWPETSSNSQYFYYQRAGEIDKTLFTQVWETDFYERCTQVWNVCSPYTMLTKKSLTLAFLCQILDGNIHKIETLWLTTTEGPIFYSAEFLLSTFILAKNKAIR